MYPFLLETHSILRWFVVILGIMLVGKMWLSRLANNDYLKSDDKLSLYFSISLDLQFIIGVLLYFIFSPITTHAFGNFGEAMKDSATRFFLVEHTTVMLIAIGLTHFTRIKVKKGKDSKSKLKIASLYYLIAFILLFFAIPWPFYSMGRSLF